MKIGVNSLKIRNKGGCGGQCPLKQKMLFKEQKTAFPNRNVFLFLLKNQLLYSDKGSYKIFEVRRGERFKSLLALYMLLLIHIMIKPNTFYNQYAFTYMCRFYI